jgi:hypothetical protein
VPELRQFDDRARAFAMGVGLADGRRRIVLCALVTHDCPLRSIAASQAYTAVATVTRLPQRPWRKQKHLVHIDSTAARLLQFGAGRIAIEC